MRIEKTMESIKTALVVVLLVALVCLCAVYMLSHQGAAPFGFTREMMNALDGESIKYQYLHQYHSSYVAPRFIGVSSERGDGVGFFYDENQCGALYADVLRFYEKLFGTQGRVESLSKKEGEALFSEAMRGGYIYLSYFCDLPKSLIVTMAEPEEVFSGISGEFIREIFILPDRYLYSEMRSVAGTSLYLPIHSFYAVARDSAGNYYRYTTSYVPKGGEDLGFSQTYYRESVTMRGVVSYTFAGALELDDSLMAHEFENKVTDTTILAQSDGLYGELSLECSVVSENSVNAYLEALFMNPERVSSYVDDANVHLYFDEGRNVRLTPNGTLQYTALGTEGISLSDLFEHRTSNEEYDTFDYIGAALTIASALDSIDESDGGAMLHATRIAGEPERYLSGLTYDGNVLSVCFGYRVGGLPVIMDGSPHAMVIELCDGMIKNVWMDLRYPKMMEQSQRMPDALWAIRAHVARSVSRFEYLPGYLFAGDLAWSDVQIISIPKSEEEGGMP